MSVSYIGFICLASTFFWVTSELVVAYKLGVFGATLYGVIITYNVCVCLSTEGVIILLGSLLQA